MPFSFLTPYSMVVNSRSQFFLLRVAPFLKSLITQGSKQEVAIVVLTVESANRVDLDELAHNEPPHQDLHCLPSIVFEFSI